MAGFGIVIGRSGFEKQLSEIITRGVLVPQYVNSEESALAAARETFESWQGDLELLEETLEEYPIEMRSAEGMTLVGWEVEADGAPYDYE